MCLFVCAHLQEAPYSTLLFTSRLFKVSRVMNYSDSSHFQRKKVVFRGWSINAREKKGKEEARRTKRGCERVSGCFAEQRSDGGEDLPT